MIDWRSKREPEPDDTLSRLETKLNLAHCDLGNEAQIGRLERAIRWKKGLLLADCVLCGLSIQETEAATQDSEGKPAHLDCVAGEL